MRWSFSPLLNGLPRRPKPSYVCAWCGQPIGAHRARVHGEPATKYGLCRSCLDERLERLDGPPPEAGSGHAASA